MNTSSSGFTKASSDFFKLEKNPNERDKKKN